MKIERFEDIKAWQESRELTKMVFGITSTGSSSKSYRLRDQLEGAAISTMANIAEGFDSQSDADFIRFLVYSGRSASESNLIYMLLLIKRISQEHNLTKSMKRQWLSRV